MSKKNKYAAGACLVVGVVLGVLVPFLAPLLVEAWEAVVLFMQYAWAISVW